MNLSLVILVPFKCPNLLKPLGTIIKKNVDPSMYPSEPFIFARFNMRHPVVTFQDCLFHSFHRDLFLSIIVKLS